MGQVPLDELDDEHDGDDKPKDRPSRREPTAKNAKADRELKDGILRVFERVTETLKARGDERLAEVIEEDAEVMAGFLVSFTRPIQALRGVVATVVALAEPALAFGRVFRELAYRVADRRAARAAAREADTGNPHFDHEQDLSE